MNNHTHFFHHLPRKDDYEGEYFEELKKKDSTQIVQEGFQLESNAPEHMASNLVVQKSTQVLGSLSRSYHKVANEVKALAHMTRHLGLPESLVKMGI